MSTAVASDAALDASTTIGAAIDAPIVDPLAELRRLGWHGPADAIARRMAQRRPKMRLTAAQGHTAAHATLALVERAPFAALQLVMPRSTVELARAVAERDVPLADAEAIAAYLVQLADAVDFKRLATFDDNHSHVTGREWHEIDYTGEGMTWQGQQAYWAPRGVTSFKRAAFVHAYMVGAERLEHWKRVYRPRNRIPSAIAPTE